MDISNLSGNEVVTIGHGGMGNQSLYPMNSFESISKCLETKADGIEVDVQMTSDNILVAYHSELLQERTNGSGRVNEITAAQFVDLKYKSNTYQSYEAALLSTILRLTAKKGKKISLDCKFYLNTSDIKRKEEHYQVFASRLSKELKENGLESSSFIESVEPSFLSFMQSEGNYETFYYANNIEEAREKASSIPLSGISMNHELISKEDVENFHSLGLKVILWGASTKNGNKLAIEKSPDHIQSDKVTHLVKLLGN